MIPKDDRRNILTVIRGEGQANEQQERRQLHALQIPKPVPAHQLGLVGVAQDPCVVVSIGIRSVSFDDFTGVLRKHAIRRVLDLRVSASYRGNGFSREAVFDMFAKYGIQYRRLSNLANQIDPSINSHARYHYYVSFLETQVHALEELKETIETGPSLLIDWSSKHEGSDREALIAVLQRSSKKKFGVVIV